MKNRKCIGPIILLMVTVFLDWEKWKIADDTTILALDFLGFFEVFLLIEWFIWCGFLVMRNIKRLKYYSALILALMIFVFGSFTFIPVSDTGIKANHIFNKPSREFTIELLNSDALTPLSPNSYNIPFICRLTSHTGKIHIESDVEYSGKKDKVMFYIHCGYNKSSAVIYTAKDTPVKNGDFGYDEYIKIKKLEPNWYMVTMK